jgi:hypothetical protein
MPQLSTAARMLLLGQVWLAAALRMSMGASALPLEQRRPQGAAHSCAGFGVHAAACMRIETVLHMGACAPRVATWVSCRAERRSHLVLGTVVPCRGRVHSSALRQLSSRLVRVAMTPSPRMPLRRL